MGGTLLQDFIPHGATRDPFPLVYSHDPASIHSYELGYVQVEAVAQSLEDHDKFLAHVHHHL